MRRLIALLNTWREHSDIERPIQIWSIKCGEYQFHLSFPRWTPKQGHKA